MEFVFHTSGATTREARRAATEQDDRYEEAAKKPKETARTHEEAARATKQCEHETKAVNCAWRDRTGGGARRRRRRRSRRRTGAGEGGQKENGGGDKDVSITCERNRSRLSNLRLESRVCAAGWAG